MYWRRNACIAPSFSSARCKKKRWVWRTLDCLSLKIVDLQKGQKCTSTSYTQGNSSCTSMRWQGSTMRRNTERTGFSQSFRSYIRQWTDGFVFKQPEQRVMHETKIKAEWDCPLYTRDNTSSLCTWKELEGGWSSSLLSSDSGSAYYTSFNSGSVYPQNYNGRCYGFTVRPVQ